MIFEELRKSFHAASHVLTRHRDACLQFHNTFAKDFPFCDVYNCEAFRQFQLARMFVQTALVHYHSGPKHDTLNHLLAQIGKSQKAFLAAHPMNSSQKMELI